MSKSSLICADSLQAMKGLVARNPSGAFDVIFADPPYFLSNGGSSCRSGKRVSVNKGRWDKGRSSEDIHQFNLDWLSLCQSLLKDTGSIWVCGTNHNIYSIGMAMRQIGFRILNDVIWEKPNPPPNLGCRTLTHSHETIIWASKGIGTRHFFNYKEIRKVNAGKQVKTVWRMPAPSPGEKTCGRHPTQKPLELVIKCLKASCPVGGRVLDPFVGSGTTSVASKILGFNSVGIDRSAAFLGIARRRLFKARAGST
jgi:site-specific DNA-methyltransferase (adenine-specific)